MVERLTDEEIHDIGKRAGLFLGQVIGETTVATVCTRELALLLNEVRERRAEEDCLGQLAAEVGLPRHDHAGIVRATKARDGAGGRERGHLARIAELEAALRECVADNDGLFSLGVQAEEMAGGSPERQAVFERVCAMQDRARAALAKGAT